MSLAPRRRDPKGAVLVVTLLLVTLLATLGVGLLNTSVNENIVAWNDVYSQRALSVAEGGIAHAREMIGANLTSTSLTSRLTGATVSVPEVALAGVSNYAALGTDNGTYSVWVSNNLTAYNKSPGYAADPAPALDTDNRIWIRSVGVYRNATKTVRVLLDFKNVSVMDPTGAVTLIDGTGGAVNFSGNAFSIQGNDTEDPTVAGRCGTPAGSKYGISVNSGASYVVVEEALKANQEDNVTGTPGVSGYGSYADNGTISASQLEAIANNLLPYAQTIPGGNHSENFGCPVQTGDCPGPGLFKATSNVKLDGSGTAYGILIVTAEFEMSGTYTWEGLIIAVGAGTVRLTGSENKIYGGILVANTLGGLTTFDIRGNSGVYRSTQALCRIKKIFPWSKIIAWQQVD